MPKNPYAIRIPKMNELMGGKKLSSGRKSCPKAVKEAVWRKYNGNRMTGKCYVCKAPIKFTNFEVGHNRARSKGGKWSVTNCRPICRTCNRSMGAMTIEAFKNKYFKTKRPSKKKPRKKRPRSIYDTSIKIPTIKIPKFKF